MFLKDYVFTDTTSLDQTATLQMVIDKMVDERLHHIVILEDKKPIGILTERDMVNHFSNHIDFNDLAITHATTDLVMLHHTRLVDYALSMMINNNIRKIIVVDGKENYVGCIEQEDLIFYLEEQIEGKTRTLAQLTHPGNKAVLINTTTTLKNALEIMITNRLSSLLVQKDNRAVGIVSESDIIKLAKGDIDQNNPVELYMHSPIIQIEEYKTAQDMIQLMKNKKIRRAVVFNSDDESYYILTSKDIAGIVKGSYTTFLESKFFETRDTFNALSEYIIELVDFSGEQVIFWTNSITKANFNIQLDDNIYKLIDKKTWDKIYDTLMETHIIFDTIKIEDRYYQIKGHYGSMTNDIIIKIFLNDITDIISLQRQLEDEIDLKNKILYDQSKMVQMGQMIGNIAHQWRQPLSVITTLASGVIFKKEMGIMEEDKLTHQMEIIVENAKYLSQTIDTFRNFIKEKKEIKTLIVQECVTKAILLTQATLKNNQITLHDGIDYENSISLSMVSGELVQVIINIINNAKDILIDNKIENPWIKISSSLENNFFIISIEDNAKGIPEDILPHIFDEYFSTKPEDIGTGLGLYMSKKIVHNSLHGELIASNTQNGAKFSIKIPLPIKNNKEKL